MSGRLPGLISFLALFLAQALLTQAGSRSLSGPVASMQRKLQHLEQNGLLRHPDPAPTAFAENEVNAYMASGAVKLPTGVRSVHFQGQSGILKATTRVDFDQLRAGRSSANPWLAVFTGTHDVDVVAHARGLGSEGLVHVDSVSLDGVETPRFVLQLFVEKYLQPRCPGVGLDSRFKLPARIDTATIGSHVLTVTQK